MTVEEIARDAGVSHMTFFRHFSTKEDVLDEACAARAADGVGVRAARDER
ncbi:TetR/AcrR family transcriptional regulator [Microbacterium sp. AK031]|nr:TetR/AcrR family transcriptional regulator [Microbacterium sp. AK031]